MDADQAEDETEDGRKEQATVLKGLTQGEYTGSDIALENVNNRLQVTAESENKSLSIC